MSGGRWMGILLATVLLGAMSAPGARAQYRSGDRWERSPSAFFGLSFIAANPVGDFGLLVDNGFGLQLEGRFPMAARGVLSLRLDGGFLIYGHERQTSCFAPPIGCRIGVDLTTTNAIAFAGVGPEIAIPGPVSPYVNASVGISYFGTHSSLSGVNDYDEDFNTRNYSDLVTSGRLGGGLRFQVGGSSRPVLLDIGAEYHRNGIAEYLRKGDIVDYADGSIELFPNRTDANLMTFRLGVTFGIGGQRSDDGDRPRRRRR